MDQDGFRSKKSPHSKDHPYVMVSKKLLDNEAMSPLAKLLLIYLLGRPDDWYVRVAHLKKILGVGRDKTRLLLKELINLGYCKKTTIKKGSNFIGILYEYAEDQVFKNCLPQPEIQAPENKAPENQAPLLNKESTNQISKEIFKEEREREGAAPPDPPPFPVFSESSLLSFGNVVKLQASEYEKLCSLFGKVLIDEYIEKINDHCDSVGKKYKDYAATIRNWIRRDKEKKQQQGAKYEDPKRAIRERQLEEYKKHNGSFNDAVRYFE